MLIFDRHDSFFFSHIFNTFDKHLFTGICMVICKIGWPIRSWLYDYISFSFYKSYCRHDTYWILVAFMIAASALIKVSRLYGLYRHLYTQLIDWHCAVILYTHLNLLNKRFWILNPESGTHKITGQVGDSVCFGFEWKLFIFTYAYSRINHHHRISRSC